ncbi:MAG TPA: hypothetical protein VEB64_09975 [Azospirillaceae bacterium]|nr:hypothetical protein [Azospirillaceae bacterium]
MVSAITTPPVTVTDRSARLKDTGVRLTGTAMSPASGMKPSDVRELVVDSQSEGRYNVKLDQTDAEYEIRDSRDKLILYGRNGSVLRPQGVYLSAGSYKIRVLDDNTAASKQTYNLDLTPRGPDTATVVGKEGAKISGTTEAEGFRGMPSDTKLLRVQTAGEFNIRINTPLTSFEVRNSRGEIIASGQNNLDPEAVQVRLDPSDTYTVTTSQKTPSAFGRKYDIDVAPRINATITSFGGVVSGNMPAAPAGQTNKQSHTLNIVGDGDFTFNFLMPNAKYKITDASGKEVVTGENKPSQLGLPTDSSLKAGKYTLTIETGVGDGSGNWLLNITKQKDKEEKPELTKIQQLLADRDQTMRDQAAGVSKTNLTSSAERVKKAQEAFNNRIDTKV